MKRRDWFLLGIYGLVVIVNVLSWYMPCFGDRMRQSVFQVTQYVQGYISSIVTFSLGEFLLLFAVILMTGAFLLLLTGLCKKAAAAFKKGRGKTCGDITENSERSGFEIFCRRYFYSLSWIIGVVSVVMSVNCFVLYHCSSFQDNYMPTVKRDYTVGELAILRDYVVRQCNELAQELKRDEDGYLVYEGDLNRRGILEMKRMGETYPLLGGYYPMPKKFTFSGFFSQQYMLGYYFPFTMEANYNDVMYIANVPVTICHELSHVKGFIYEDDANFIGYLACTSSEDPFFRYSGYLSVLDYLNRDLYESLDRSFETYQTYEQCSALVERDNVFLTKEAWAAVESRAVLDTETVRQASHTFLQTNLQINGIEEGTASYGKVVEQLLTYYDGVLY